MQAKIQVRDDQFVYGEHLVGCVLCGKYVVCAGMRHWLFNVLSHQLQIDNVDDHNDYVNRPNLG